MLVGTVGNLCPLNFFFLDHSTGKRYFKGENLMQER
jgi:hypothetical protein